MTQDCLIYTPLPNGISPTIDLPLSKSIQARIMLLNAVDGDFNTHTSPYDCRDIITLAAGINAIYQSRQSGQQMLINADESGTALRFLIALAAALPGVEVKITGKHRLLQRPISPLVNALRKMGAFITESPLCISGRKLKWQPSNELFTQSSQFLSAIILIAPLLGISPAEIHIPNNMPSRPYAEMSMNMALNPSLRHNQPDWSAAAFFYEYCALSGQSIKLNGLDSFSNLQGDAAASHLFKKLGVSTIGNKLTSTTAHIEDLQVNMRPYPDLIPPFLTAAALKAKTTILTGAESLILKESNRIEALALGLTQFGVDCKYLPINKGTIIAQRKSTQPSSPTINSFSDHRIAMAFACATPALKPNVPLLISPLHCVDKSFPSFFHQLAKVGITIVTKS